MLSALLIAMFLLHYKLIFITSLALIIIKMTVQLWLRDKMTVSVPNKVLLISSDLIANLNRLNLRFPRKLWSNRDVEALWTPDALR
mgnify:CR=1 FL=1